MQYLGGKTRIAKQLAAEIDKIRRPGQWVWDAFCGGLSMTVALSKNGPVYSTDACVPLIALYRAVQAGWDPPTEVSREQWQAAKALPDTDPMKAFCGFGCSFGGKWFGGYAHDANGTRNRDGVPSNYALSAKRKLAASAPHVRALDALNFLDQEPRPSDGVLYLDPPYAGTTGYDGVTAFDHARFRQRCAEWSAHSHVFVSEYQMPFGQVVWSGVQCTTVARKKSAYADATERLYYIAKGSL